MLNKQINRYIKKMNFNIQIVLGFLLFITSANSFSQVSKVWQTDSVFKAPESVVFDSKRNCLYVANYNDKGGFKRGEKSLHNEFISKLDLNGNIQSLKWLDSLHNPTGMAIFKDKLYIVEREGLTVLILKIRKLKIRFLLKKHLF